MTCSRRHHLWFWAVWGGLLLVISYLCTSRSHPLGPGCCHRAGGSSARPSNELVGQWGKSWRSWNRQINPRNNERTTTKWISSFFICNYSSHSAVSKLTGDQNKLVCENHSSSLWINAITSVMKRNPPLQALPVVWQQEVTRCRTQGILQEVDRVSQRSQLICRSDLQLFTTSDSFYSDSQSRDGSHSNFLF